jgi:Tol biopolymer transport system component
MQGIFARSVRPAALIAACTFVAIACRDAGRIVDPTITPPEEAPSQEELRAVDVVYANESGLFTSKADGTQRVQLAAGDFRAASVSPDGKRLAYTRNGIAYVSNIDGTDAKEIASSVSGRPAWSPDQNRLAITLADGAIYTVDIASLELTQITQPDRYGARDGSAAWSPDGERIAFTRTGEDFNSIWTVGADGTHEFNIGDGEPFNYGVPSRSPVWSPDGKKIAFAVYSYGLSVMNADGTGAVYLRLPNAWASFISVDDWSPDGKWIAFQVSSAGGRVDEFLIDLESRVARVNGNESWFAVSLRTPVPPE